MAAALTLKDVVERLSEQGITLTRAALSKYECLKSTPSARMLIYLARCMGVTTDYFLHEPRVTLKWLAFRKHSTLSRSRQDMVKAIAAEVVERQVRLHMTLTPDQQPRFPKIRQVQSLDDAERLAEAVREQWQLGEAPLDSVTRTVEDRGGVVVGVSLGDRRFDGLAGWANERFPVIVTNVDAPADRRRYNIAHELGHLAMHGDGSPSAQEKIAHRFAAAFLVPAEVARRELGTKRHFLDLKELLLLKEKYGLSLQAWIRRAFDLAIVGAAQYRALCKRVSMLGWRRREPAEYSHEGEPRRLQQLVLRCLSEKVITPSEAEYLQPGCLAAVKGTEVQEPSRSAWELLRASPEERATALAAAAELAAPIYSTNRDLGEFEAFGETDLFDAPET